MVHRAIARGIHQDIGRQLGAIGECDRLGVDAFDVVVAFELDAAIGHQLAGTHIDVVARASAQVLHEQARIVVTKVEHEARLFKPTIQTGFALFHFCVNRNVEAVHDFVGHAGKHQIGFVVVDATLDRFFAVQAAQRQLHQCIRGRDVGAAALDHGDINVVFPQRGANIVG